MFHKLFRKYNQNRRTIWAVIIFVAFFVILLQVIFNIVRVSRDRELQISIQNAQNSQANTDTLNETNNESYNQVVIDTQNSSENTTIQNTIQQFVDLCNQNQIDRAYEMLTQDCKQVLYPTVGDFQSNYINQIFTQDKSIKIENSMYGAGISRVTFYNGDLLATGGYSSGETLQDYIFITEENGEAKLSINKFIRTEEINKNTTIDSVYMNVLKKDIYVDYEVYQIQVTNQSNNPLLLSDKENANSIIIVDQNEVQYSSNIDEIATERLIINPQTTSIYQIRFNKLYNTQRESQSIHFSDIIMNYQQNQGSENIEIINIIINF